MGGSWFVRAKPKPDAPLRLFCFPHAGGAASAYFAWGAALDGVDVAAVQLPGREGRLAESPETDMATLLDRLAGALAATLDGRPFAFFGHSMGAVLAYETARGLRRRGLPEPVHLHVSGRRAPTLPVTEPPLHPLPDDAFIAELNRRFGGLPAAILAEPDLLALFLPTLRADITLLERHSFHADPPLALPITAYGGQDDRQTPPESLDGWAALTTGPFAARLLPGGHFFLHENRDAFLRVFAAALDRSPVPA